MEQNRLVRVGVNKAVDQFVRAESVVPQGEMEQNRLDDTPYVPSSVGSPPSRRRRAGTSEKLRVAEAEFNRRLEES